MTSSFNEWVFLLRVKVSWYHFLSFLNPHLRILPCRLFFIVHFSPPKEGFLWSCTVKSRFGQLFNDFFCSSLKCVCGTAPNMLRQERFCNRRHLVKKWCLAGCAALHTSNYSLLLFCQLQWISCSLVLRMFLSLFATKFWNYSDLFYLLSFFSPIKSPRLWKRSNRHTGAVHVTCVSAERFSSSFHAAFSERSLSHMHLQSVACLHLLLYCDLETRSWIFITFKTKSLKRSDVKVCSY